MQSSDSLREQIIAQYDAMSAQLQQAARYVLEHPEEVALVSMREVARNACVQPATMTRLAKFLGLAGYDDIRAQHAAALRQGSDGFAAKVRQRADEGSERGVSDIASHMKRINHLGDALVHLIVLGLSIYNFPNHRSEGCNGGALWAG